MNNLVIDKGNSSIKVGVYDEACNQLYMNRFVTLTESALLSLSDEFSCNRCIVSSVVNDLPHQYEELKARMDKFITLDEHTPLPIENLYSTPSTLGRDRLAVCVGANYIKPNQNLLVIDVGTAVTYDIVNSKNQYVGGNISLGLEMRAKAMHAFTAKLPEVKIDPEVGTYGTTTETALQSGVMRGLQYEIEGYMTCLSKIYPHLSVFLTGGGSFYFEKFFKSAIFAKDLLLLGLNRILIY